MLGSILIAIFTLTFLIFIHELGHYLPAKKFGVKVEEFCVGFPPRIVKRKIGESVFSIGILPFGGFVKLFGEEGKKGEGSFSEKTLFERAIIVISGILSFWIIAWVLLSLLCFFGLPVQVEDNEKVKNAFVEVAFVVPGSPAEKAQIKPGDIIREIITQKGVFEIDKVEKVRELARENINQEIQLKIERNKEIVLLKITPTKPKSLKEGALGLALVRVVKRSYPIYLAPFKAFEFLILTSKNILISLILLLKSIVLKEKILGIEVGGPIRVIQLFAYSFQSGFLSYLSFLVLIALHLAIINLLPIPGLDGGKLLFLLIEKIRKKPISWEVEQQITTAFAILLFTILILVTLNDIKKLF